MEAIIKVMKEHLEFLLTIFTKEEVAIKVETMLRELGFQARVM